jgi:hypothetical protein
MKVTFIQLLFFAQCICVLCGQGVRFSQLSEKDTVAVAKNLDSFDNGSATLDSLTGSQEGTMRILEYYVMHTNEVTTKMKLPIAKSYAVWGKYPEAAELAQDYVGTYSNDWRGWRVLGGSKVAMKSYNEAVDALTKAERLGDNGNYSALGGAALMADRLDVFESIALPHLLMLANDTKGFPERERNQMRGLLIVYALRTENESIFLKAIDKVNMRDISQWEELKNLIAQGCARFNGSDIDTIRKELQAATEISSSSTATNASPKQQ